MRNYLPEKRFYCRVCGRPDYIGELCLTHYRLTKAGADYYPDKEQEKHEAKGHELLCGCDDPAHHRWDCADNPYREVGEEYIFRVSEDEV